MRENWPDRAIICIPDMNALTEFVEYCEASGVMWWNHPIRAAIDVIGAYMAQRDGDVCIRLQPDCNFGYCYKEYYAHSSYHNEDPQWNFCTVAEFIEWTGGYQSDEQCEIDFDSML